MVLIINMTSPLWYWVTRYSPGIAKWLDTTYKTKTDQDLTLNGHIPGQLLFAVNDRFQWKEILLHLRATIF
jgi:hypothetical protein